MGVAVMAALIAGVDKVPPSSLGVVVGSTCVLLALGEATFRLLTRSLEPVPHLWWLRDIALLMMGVDLLVWVYQPDATLVKAVTASGYFVFAGYGLLDIARIVKEVRSAKKAPRDTGRREA